MTLTKTPICDFGKGAESFSLKSTENKLTKLVKFKIKKLKDILNIKKV